MLKNKTLITNKDIKKKQPKPLSSIPIPQELFGSILSQQEIVIKEENEEEQTKQVISYCPKLEFEKWNEEEAENFDFSKVDFFQNEGKEKEKEKSYSKTEFFQDDYEYLMPQSISYIIKVKWKLKK